MSKWFTKLAVIKTLVIVLGLVVLMAPFSPAEATWKTDKVKVMTRNLYLGADIFKVVDAALEGIPNPLNPACAVDPTSPDCDYLTGADAIPFAATEVFQTVQQTNFPERAEALANEIWFHKPQLIGLQEVSTYYMQTPGDAAGGGTVPATTEVYNFLDILMNALANRQLDYEVAVVVTNADIEVPMIASVNPLILSDIRLVDHDVILVRSDVAYSNDITGTYRDQVSLDLGVGAPISFTRGWTSVDVTVCGEDYRFVNTHLEVRSSTDSIFRVVQSGQMFELLSEVLIGETKPTILVGDFNSSEDDIPGTGCNPFTGECFNYVPPYLLAGSFGYKDAWNEILIPRDGFTCCFDEFVSDPEAELTSRIDLIFVKENGKPLRRAAAMVTGSREFNMTPSGLWPSDHAGLVSQLVFED